MQKQVFFSNSSFASISGLIGGYVQSAYPPFGSPLIGRTYQAESLNGYRFGFNGKEMDDETYGDGNELDFGERISDSRLGKWFSIDQLEKKYPMHSPYIYCADNPTLFIDSDGKDWFVNNKTGMVIYIRDATSVSNDLFKKLKMPDENPSDYERLGPNDMFGKKVNYGSSTTLLEWPVVTFWLGSHDDEFFKEHGYAPAEKVTIEETVRKSGGRMGSEDFESVDASLTQKGDSKITLVKKQDLNKKKVLEKKESSSRFSSSKRILYNLTKPMGQKNEKTSEYPENRKGVTKNQAKLAEAIISLLVEVLTK